MRKNLFKDRKFLSLVCVVLGIVCIIISNFTTAGTVQHVLLSCLVLMLGVSSYIVLKIGVKGLDK